MTDKAGRPHSHHEQVEEHQQFGEELVIVADELLVLENVVYSLNGKRYVESFEVGTKEGDEGLERGTVGVEDGELLPLTPELRVRLELLLGVDVPP